MTDNAVQLTITSGGVAWVTLNRPEKHNAFHDTIIAELAEVFTKLAGNDSVRVMVLAAEGKSFSAGADLSWMQRMATYTYKENLGDAKGLAEMLHRLDTLPFTTIARVQGAAFGGAVGLVSCCDLAIGTDRASFSLSEVKIGLVPATISPYVIAAMGRRAARRYFQTAERFSAKTALQLGLLSEVVSEDQLDAEIEKLVQLVLTNSPQAVRLAKQLVVDVADKPVTDALIHETCELIANIRVSAEGQEGLKAFLEKRKPAWLMPNNNAT